MSEKSVGLKTVVYHYRVPKIYPGYYRKSGQPKTCNLFMYRRGIGFLRFDGDDAEPFEKGGKTIVEIHNLMGDVIAVGEAVCSYSDQFEYKKGYLIAKGRAEKQIEKFYD